MRLPLRSLLLAGTNFSDSGFKFSDFEITYPIYLQYPVLVGTILAKMGQFANLLN